MSERLSTQRFSKRLGVVGAASAALLLASLAPTPRTQEQAERDKLWAQIESDRRAVQPVVPPPAPGSNPTVLAPDSKSDKVPNFDPDTRHEAAIDWRQRPHTAASYSDCDGKNGWAVEIINQGQGTNAILGLAGSWERRTDDPTDETHYALLQDGVEVLAKDGERTVTVTPLYGEPRTFDRVSQGDFQQFQTAAGRWVTTGLVEVRGDLDFVVGMSCEQEVPPIFIEGWES